MAQIEPLNLFGAYARGRGVALDEQQARQAMESNRLRDMYLSNQEARTQAQFDASQQNQQANTEQAKRERAMAAAPLLGKLARDMLATGNPRQSMAAAIRNPEVLRLFADVGITPDQMDLNDPELEQDLQTWAQFAEQGKQAPQVNIMSGPMDSQIVTYGNTMEVLRPQTGNERPVLTDVPLPDGSVQKQWIKPGASSGAPVGAPKSPDSGPSMKDVTSLRKEFESTDAAKNYRAVLPLYNRAKTAPNTRAGDISLIYALGKMFDPNSVVKDSELVLAQNAAPWLVKMASQANSQITSQGQLNKQTRDMIMEALKGQVDSFRIPYEQERERYSQYAGEYGIDPFKVVGNDPMERYSGAQPAPTAGGYPTATGPNGQKLILIEGKWKPYDPTGESVRRGR